jgi:hypothetical protein
MAASPAVFRGEVSMREDVYDKWKQADDIEKLWLDLRDCISRYADKLGAFGTDGRFVRPLREYQGEIDKCAGIKRDAEREGLRELDRDPADDWMREAFQSKETFADYVARHVTNAQVSVFWEPGA